MKNIHLLTDEQRRMLQRPMPAILPVGWTITCFPGTIEINDHSGRLIHAIGKPLDPIPLTTLAVAMMNDICAGKSIVKIKWL